MATYSAVSAGEKDADSPINVGLIDKLDQNPHAIAEGASGAPRIKKAAIERYNEFNLFDFGDGSDGSSTISSNSNIDSGLHQYVNLTINSGVTLTKNTSQVGPLILKCTGTLTISGTIRCGNQSLLADCGGTAGGGGSGYDDDTNDHLNNGTDSGDSIYSVGAAAGFSTTAGAAGVNLPLKSLEAGLCVGALKYGGGKGPDGGDGFDSFGATDDGGAGGEGGGVLIIVANTVVFNSGATIDCSGSNGASGDSQGGGGAGGGGGSIVILYKTFSTDSGTYDVSGGTGVTKSNSRTSGAGGNGQTLKLKIDQT